MSDRATGILCCGNSVADIQVRPVSEPGWGKTTWVDTIALNLGGNGASTSYTLSKLGNSVRLFSAVGRDHFGDELLRQLQSVGVDTSQVERSSLSPTAISVALVHPDGSRALLQRPGVSREALSAGITLSTEFVTNCSQLHLANIFALQMFQTNAPALLAQGRELGLRTSMDAGWDAQGRWLDTLGPCLRYTDLLFVNSDEAKHLTGLEDPERAASVLRRYGADTVVVKLGPQGCLVSTGTQRFSDPAFAVDPIDTTGAGDCFAAGFIAAQQRGFDLREAARFANAVGALSVRGLGAVSGILSFDETVKWMRDYYDARFLVPFLPA